MRLAACRVMALSLLRDPAALAMSFLLPGVVYVIFAAIFSGATGGDLVVRVAIADERQDAASLRLLAAVIEQPKIVRLGGSELGPGHVRALVQSGEADAGIVLHRSARALDDLDGEGPPAIVLIGDPGREIAMSILQGAVQKAYFSALPHAAVGSIARRLDREFVGFSPEQRQRLERGLDAMRKAGPGNAPAGLKLDGIYERRDAASRSGAPIAVTYYAAAVAMMFLLFSALTGAMSLLEERESGLLERLAASPGGIGVLIDGKFLFMVAQGFVQVAVIYVVAWLVFGVALPASLVPWAATTLAAAIAAAGLALFFVTLCRSRQQAQTLGQMLILVISAVGGSMVPRFLMPGYVQSLGWATPNTWALEAYTAIFARGEATSTLWGPWTVLIASGIFGLLGARILGRGLG